MRPTSFRVATLAAYAIVTAAACSDSAAPRATSPVSLSFRTGAVASLGVSAAPASVAPTGDVRIELGTDAIEITRVAVVVRKIELASTDVTACDDDSDRDTDGVDTDGSDDDSRGSEGCTEVEIGPRLAAAGARRAAEEFARLPDPAREAGARRLLGVASLALGRADEAREAIERAVRLAHEHGSLLIEAESLRARAELLASVGARGDATTDARAAMELFARLGRVEDETAMREWLEEMG